jgi:hypothetical protein
MAALPDLDFSHLAPVGADPAFQPLSQAASAGEVVGHDVDGPDPRIPAPRIDVPAQLGARIYTLLSPFKVDGKWRRTITMRHPTQGEIDAWGNGEIDGARGLILAMTSLHPAVFKALAWPDAAALHQMFSDMVPGFVIGQIA